MKPYTLVLSKNFQKNLLKSVAGNASLKEKLTRTLSLLQENPKHPSLRLHKLSGIGRWSVSINMSLRIIFSIEDNKIYLLHLGTHDQVY